MPYDNAFSRKDFTESDASEAIVIHQHEYAITSRITSDSKESKYPLLCTVGVYPCVSVAIFCDDEIGTTLLAHFSAHAKGSDEEVRHHVKDSLDQMLKDADIKSTTNLSFHIMGGNREWSDGKSEKLASYVKEAIQKTPNATIQEDHLFEGIHQIAVDARTKQVFYDDSVNNLFVYDKNDVEAKQHTSRLFDHGCHSPSLPLMKHYKDGRMETTEITKSNWSERNPKRDPGQPDGTGWAKSKTQNG